MSKFIPQTNRSPQPRWFYLANPKTGEVIRQRRSIPKPGKKGFGLTSRAIFQRAHGNKYNRNGIIRNSFTPSEYPTGSGNFVPTNIVLR